MAAMAALAAGPQINSRLFQQLSQEIRDKIYSHVFSSTCLGYGLKEGVPGQIDLIRIKPTPNVVALLRTCRRARMEVGDAWIGQISFYFKKPLKMLDILMALPPGILSRIRHLRIAANPVYLKSNDGHIIYDLASTLRLLPHLRLDTLIVPGPPGHSYSYAALDELISESCGWKELRYLSSGSGMLGFASIDPDESDDYGDIYGREYRRHPQPAHWQRVLEDRDGVLSRPSVTIYRSTVPQGHCSILNADTRERFEQQIPKDVVTREAFGIVYDLGLVVEGEKDKEMMFVIRTGAGVDYEQTEDSPLIQRDIRRDMPGKTWKIIREEWIGGFSYPPYPRF